MAVTWLHISDFHFKTGDAYDRDVVLRALIAAVTRFRKEGRQPDLIFATGDIAYSGKASEYTLAEQFFDELLKSAGLPRKCLYVVPGNHDVDRAIAKGLNHRFESNEEFDDAFAPDSEHHHFKKFSAYREWYNAYFSGIRSCPENTTCTPFDDIEINGQPLSILLLNSALLALENENRDCGKLWLSRRWLGAALSKHAPDDKYLRLALLHHPLDWLHVDERSNIKSSLFSHVDFMLRGHLHETDAEGIATAADSVLLLAAGAAYQTRKYPQQALYCTVNDNMIEVFPIHYVDKPKENWTLDTSVFSDQPGYIGHFPLPRRAAPPPVVPPSGPQPPNSEPPDDAPSEMPHDHRQLRIAEELLTNPLANAFFKKLQAGYARHVSLESVPATEQEMVRQFARRPASNVKKLFYAVRRGLEEIPSAELESASRTHIDKTASALYWIAACRLVNEAAHAQSIATSRTCINVVQITTNSEIICAVIATALFGGELRVVLDDDQSHPVPEYVFNVRDRILGDLVIHDFELAVYFAVFPNDRKTGEIILNGSLSPDQSARLAVHLGLIREYHNFSLALVIHGSFPKDVCDQFARKHEVPVMLLNSETTTALLGMDPTILDASIKEFWKFKTDKLRDNSP